MRCESCPLAGVVTRLWASFVALSTPMWIFSLEVELVAFLRKNAFQGPASSLCSSSKTGR